MGRMGRRADFAAVVTGGFVTCVSTGLALGADRAGHTIKAQRPTARFIHNGNLGNPLMLALDFDHCGFKFSRCG